MITGRCGRYSGFTACRPAWKGWTAIATSRVSEPKFAQRLGTCAHLGTVRSKSDCCSARYSATATGGTRGVVKRILRAPFMRPATPNQRLPDSRRLVRETTTASGPAPPNLGCELVGVRGPRRHYRPPTCCTTAVRTCSGCSATTMCPALGQTVLDATGKTSLNAGR